MAAPHLNMGNFLLKNSIQAGQRKQLLLSFMIANFHVGQTEQIVVCSDPEGTNSGSRSLFPNILSPSYRGRRREGREKGGRRRGGLDTKSCGLNSPKRTIDIKRGDRGTERGKREGVGLRLVDRSIGSLTE